MLAHSSSISAERITRLSILSRENLFRVWHFWVRNPTFLPSRSGGQTAQKPIRPGSFGATLMLERGERGRNKGFSETGKEAGAEWLDRTWTRVQINLGDLWDLREQEKCWVDTWSFVHHFLVTDFPSPGTWPGDDYLRLYTWGPVYHFFFSFSYTVWSELMIAKSTDGLRGAKRDKPR